MSQALLLGIAVVLLFPISVYATGYTARKISVVEASYAEALWATVFKNVSVIVALALFDDYLSLPPAFTLALAGVVIPIVVYWRVFLSTIRQAATIWIIVLGVELVAGTCLVAGALLVGTWLDQKYDFNALFAAATPAWHAAIVLAIPVRHSSRRRLLHAAEGVCHVPP